jgi:hypothetical protein
MSDFDDEDWVDLEKVSASSVQKPDVTISLKPAPGRHNPKVAPRVRAVVWLRRAAAEWIEAHGPRFKTQVGGKGCNLLRIVRQANGPFEAAGFKGVKRLGIGLVNLWPNEIRADVEAKWVETPGGLVLTLPDDFALPGQGDAPKAREEAPVQKPAPRPATPQPFPITTAARGLERRVSRDELVDAMETKARAFPCEIGGVKITPSERDILDVLLKRERVSKEGLLAATLDPGADDDDRDAKSVDVWVCKLRAKLSPLGIAIETLFGEGYRLDAGSKARLRTFVDKARAA